MNVLSLFDGCATGLFVLKKLGIEVTNYFASEVDKHAMAVAKDNHPEIIHIGDVTKVFAKDLPKIDMIIGGSPCQGFSFAGKQLNFDDPRSKLFFEYVRLLHECKPKYFFLENVRMKKEYIEVISEALDCDPILFNSKLVCAQSRPRLYWTNIAAAYSGLFGRVKFGGYIPTKDRGIVLKDILQDNVDESYYCAPKDLDFRLAIGSQLNPNTIRRIAEINGGGQGNRVYDDKGKAASLSAQTGGTGPDSLIFAGRITGRKLDENGNRNDNLPVKETQRVEANDDPQKTNCLTTVSKDNVLIKLDRKGKPKPNQNKASCFTAGGNSGGNHSDMDLFYDGQRIRRLTEIECERLQGLTDGYTKAASKTQRYKMLGNGWQADTIELFFKYLK